MSNSSMFKGVVFQSGGHGIVPIDHPMEHGEVDAPIYAFQSWVSGGELSLSDLYEGDAAIEFIDRHYESGTFAQLTQGGNDVKEEYEDLQAQIEADRYAEMWD